MPVTVVVGHEPTLEAPIGISSMEPSIRLRDISRCLARRILRHRFGSGIQ